MSRLIRSRNWLAKCVVMAAGLVVVPAFANEANREFELLAEDIWQYRLQQSPLSASYYGIEVNPGDMPDLSTATLRAEHKKTLGQLEQLAAINLDLLSEQNRINLAVLKHRLDNVADSYTYNAHQIPLTAEGGFHTSLGFLPGTTQFTDKQDFENYLSRLSQFPRYFTQNINWMRQGLKAGNSQPQVVLQGYEQSIDGYLTKDVKDNPFYKPFLRDYDFLSEEEMAALQLRAQDVVKSSVEVAYQYFREFMVDEYIPAARTSIGVSETPDGKAFYANRAKHYTTTDLTPEQIHELGLEQVKRIRAEMAEIIKQVNFQGDFADFLQFLRSDPQFYAKTPEQLLMKASYIAKQMDAKLPTLFKHLPRTPYGVAPVPEHIAPKYTTGRYVGASKDTDAGYYWVNTYALDRRPLYELEALTLHEAVPGHHLQISLSREMENTPLYRSSYYMSAFGEGWGLYAEWLGLEAGFYQDPYSNFGRLTYEMWRATRLVVDTGMHVMGWSRQQAIDYMKQNSALSEHNITTEVDRYISWPGQALSYKIGELTIRKLRKKAEDTLGGDFDVREFHYQVLKNGSVPLSILEQQIEDYLNSVKGS